MDDIRKSISDHQEQIKNNILRGFVDNDLNKSIGEGSRGGSVIGHTKSGKPVYDKFSHADHKDFDRNDHLDAMFIHEKIHRKKNKMDVGGANDKARKEALHGFYGVEGAKHTAAANKLNNEEAVKPSTTYNHVLQNEDADTLQELGLTISRQTLKDLHDGKNADKFRSAKIKIMKFLKDNPSVAKAIDKHYSK
jgi:hypothetical protein